WGVSVRVQRVVELDAHTRAVEHLDGTGRGVAAEQQVAADRALAGLDGRGAVAGRDDRGTEDGDLVARRDVEARLDDAVVADRVDRDVDDVDLGPRRDVWARLDDAVVAERDAEARVGAQQAPLTQGDDALAAAGQRPHDRGAATDVGPVAHGDDREDAALD